MDSVNDKCTLSIVVPIFNESDNIIAFYERTIKVLDELSEPYEIIFINDGSTDDSLDLLVELHKKDRKIKIINFSRNFGKEIAMTAGIDYASGEAVVPIDADLQDPPEVIVNLFDKWKEGYDVVYATRSSREGETWLKKWSSKMFYKVMCLLTNIEIPRDTGDFRLIDRKAVEALKRLREHHRFMKGLFSWVGYKQIGILYNRDPRYGGKTKWNFRKLFGFAIEGITSFSYIPLKFASLMGIIVSFLSFVYGIFIVIKTLIFGNPVHGYPSLIVIVLFLGGIQLLTIGIIGEYIGRVYNETKRRTLYFVRDTFGFSKSDST